LPARNIDSIKVFRHLSQHRRLQTAIGITSFSIL
jgi:hypothetical protein